MACRGVAGALGIEFRLLQFGIGGHAALAIVARQFEHAVIEAVEASQRDELKFVAHRAQFALEAGDVGFVEIGAPIERGRAIVRQQLVGKFSVNRFGECPCLFQIGARCFHP